MQLKNKLKCAFILQYGICNYLLCKCLCNEIEDTAKLVKKDISNPIEKKETTHPHTLNTMKPAAGII